MKTNDKIIEDIPELKPSMLPSSVEDFTYIDLKNSRTYKFMRDCNNKKELILDNDEVTSIENMRKLDVYSSIAAGNPILINSTAEDVFYIPNEWLPGNDDCYMVRVKGDSYSVINSEINSLIKLKLSLIIRFYSVLQIWQKY